MKLLIIQKIIYPVYMTNNNEIFALVNAAATAAAGSICSFFPAAIQKT
jgi:hypothetical protein